MLALALSACSHRSPVFLRVQSTAIKKTTDKIIGWFLKGYIFKKRRIETAAPNEPINMAITIKAIFKGKSNAFGVSK